MSSKKINARTQKWRQMIKQNQIQDQNLIKNRIRKGIPKAIRSLAWPYILNVNKFMKQKQKNINYQKLLHTPSNSTYQISLDIPRTFPEEQDSKFLKHSLNNVLKALSIVYPRVGYCQGMNFLVSRILQILDDEEAFWFIYCLFQKDQAILRNFIDPSRIDCESSIFQKLFQKNLTNLYNHFILHGITMHLFTVRWFMTLFSSLLSQQLFNRIFEIYLKEGWWVLYAVGLALLKRKQQQMLKQNLYGVVLIINSKLQDVKQNYDQFIQLVCSYNISEEQIHTHMNNYKQKQGQKLKLSRKSIDIREHNNKNIKIQLPQQEPNLQEYNIIKTTQNLNFDGLNILEHLKFNI